jgi:hypothetical protein
LSIALREERAERAIDQAGGEGLLIMGAAFSLEEAARDLASGVGPFLVIDRERKEVDPLTWLLGGHRRYQNDCIAKPD